MNRIKPNTLLNFILTFSILTMFFVSLLIPKFTVSENYVRATYIIVDINGNGDYTKIQYAIDNASDGDIIQVWEGTYFENLKINKTISLIGNSTENTIINGNQSGDVVLITADWVNISDLAITGSKNHFSSIKIENANYCNITRCYCYNNLDGNGIKLDYSSNSNIYNNNCSYNSNGIVIKNSYWLAVRLF